MARTPPPCDFVLDGQTCGKVGDHFCEPRAGHAVAFFTEILVHTKGRYARRAFIPADWQRTEILEPVFGTVTYSQEYGSYVRRYLVVWIELGRKNGKALAVDTPILAEHGWATMGQLVVGDRIHALDGSLTTVMAKSETHYKPTYRVRLADGAELVACEDHQWTLRDGQVVTTGEMAGGSLVDGRGARYKLPVPAAVQRLEVALPVDPYVFGAWLGNGASRGNGITMGREDRKVMADEIERAGYAVTLSASDPLRIGVLGLQAQLRALGVLGNKHVPEAYLLGSADQRLALLQGLMDTDGSVILGRNRPRVEFAQKRRQIAEAVLFLARSLGQKAAIHERVVGEYGTHYRVGWTPNGVVPFRMPRKAALVDVSPVGSRVTCNSVVAVERVDTVATQCITVDHPSHTFLAGRSLTPTHNSELLAGIMLYLLCADGEESAEIYGCARDRDQASLAFDVAARMVQLSPVLSRRLTVRAHNKRIIDVGTNSFYQVIAADAAGALGSNPSGVAADEILAWRDRSMWDALRTGMGSGARRQPLMVAATTAGNDPAGFAAAMHAEMERVAEDPARAPHVFAFMRNTPRNADPFDEANWQHANPALGDFLSVEAMRKEALEARNDPAAENGFRQFRLNQWVQQASRWMPMHLYNGSSGDLWLRPDWGREQLKGRIAWAGFDLAAKMDLTAWCLVFPRDDNEPLDVLWRFWLPEAAVAHLDKHSDGKVSRWITAGWITATDGEVLDYDQVYADIEEDAKAFKIVGGDCDKWSMFPVIQEIAKRTRLQEETQLVPRSNTFADMTPGMTALMGLVKEARFHHHGNPVAQWCFDNVEIRHSRENPELIRPEKPERGAGGKRIDAVPAASLAVGAWAVRGKQGQSRYRRVTGKVSGY